MQLSFSSIGFEKIDALTRINIFVDNRPLFLYNKFNHIGLVLYFILKGGIILWMNCIQE